MVEGSTAHGLEIKRSIVVSMGCPPAPVYKGPGEEVAGQEEGTPRGVLLPPGVGFPPSYLEWEREGGERGKERGAPPPDTSPTYL